MQSFTLQVDEENRYGVLTRGSAGEAVPFRMETPDPDTIVLHLDQPPSDSMVEALDRVTDMRTADILNYFDGQPEEQPSITE